MPKTVGAVVAALVMVGGLVIMAVAVTLLVTRDSPDTRVADNGGSYRTVTDDEAHEMLTHWNLAWHVRSDHDRHGFCEGYRRLGETHVVETFADGMDGYSKAQVREVLMPEVRDVCSVY